MAREVLIICRHGKPALSKKVRLNWLGYIDWWKKYDEGGLDKKQKLPKRVSKIASEADVVISSTLRRAVESATLAACLLYTSPSPRDLSTSRMPSSA